MEKLSPGAIRGLIESFILRDGTDYGEAEVSFEDKVRQLEGALRSRRARIVFDEATESFTIQKVD